MANVVSITSDGYIVEEDGDGGRREYHITTDPEDEDAAYVVEREVVYEGRGAYEADEPEASEAVHELMVERGVAEGDQDAADEDEAESEPDDTPEDEEDADDGEKYVCEVCGEDYDSRAALAGHMNAHSD